jgi:hypothetical protein
MRICPSSSCGRALQSTPLIRRSTRAALRANASRFRYICTEHDEWERQHNEVAGAWRDALCDLITTVPTTRQGAIALIDAFLLYQEADMDRTQYSELLARLKAFLQSGVGVKKMRGLA